MLRPIKNYPNYAISNKNNLVLNIKTGRVLKPCKDNHGYLMVVIHNNGKRKTFKVHRLVAEHFIDNPDNKRCVNHKDGNKLNNDAPNLEWVTDSENMQHAHDTGLNKGTINCKVKSKPVQGTCIKTGKIVKFPSTAEAQRQGFSQVCVSNCCNGKVKTHKKYTWKYI